MIALAVAVAGTAAAIAVVESTTSSPQRPASAPATTVVPVSGALPTVVPSTTTTPEPPGASIPVGFDPISFTAISPTRWWLLGKAPCGAEDCLAVVGTRNAGQTFQSLAAPPGAFLPTHPSTAPGSEIRFADPTDGWVFDPGLYATHDGGRTWETVTINHEQVQSLAAGTGEVYAVFAPPPTPCTKAGTCTNLALGPGLYRTQPWSDAWNADPLKENVTVGLTVHERSIWVMNAMPTPDGPAVGTGLLHSSDGGDEFTLEPQPVPGIACIYSPVTDTVVWAYCSGGHFMTALRSTDAGTEFKSVGGTTAPDGYPNGSTLVGATATVAVAASDLPGHPLLRTTDGGTSWTAVQAAPSTTGVWTVLGFTTSDNGYAFLTQNASVTDLWRTTDGGRTWSAVVGL